MSSTNMHIGSSITFQNLLLTYLKFSMNLSHYFDCLYLLWLFQHSLVWWEKQIMNKKEECFGSGTLYRTSCITTRITEMVYGWIVDPCLQKLWIIRLSHIVLLHQSTFIYLNIWNIRYVYQQYIYIVKKITPIYQICRCLVKKNMWMYLVENNIRT